MALANNGAFDVSNYDKAFTKGTLRVDPIVTFNKNTGTGSMSAQTVTYNAQTTLTQNTFTKTGYTFSGWNTKQNGSGTSYADKGKITTKVNTTLYAQWTPNTNTAYVVKHYVHDLETNTYTLALSENKQGTTDSTVTFESLKKQYNSSTPNVNTDFAGFTYDEGFVTSGSTTKPTSGAVTQTTILPDGSRVISLYYRRNRLLLQYNANEGEIKDDNGRFALESDGTIKRIDNGGVNQSWVVPNTQWMGVYGSIVGGILDDNTYQTGTTGLPDWNNPSHINLQYINNGVEYKASGTRAWSTTRNGDGAVYSQVNAYNAIDFATSAGQNLADGDVTIKLYVN